MQRLRSQLTYSNVVSTLCLILLVGGGTAYAASKALPKNSVGSKQIKKGAVTGAKLANGSVTGAKVALSSLGTVPSAAHAADADQATNAGNAASLGGLSAAEIEAAAKPACPAGTAAVPGACIETATRAAATYTVALENCARAGGTLPTAPQLASFQITHLGLPPGPEWAGGDYYDGTEYVAQTMNADSAGVLTAGAYPIGETLPYRCDMPAS